ncbi:hypothetical protein [Hyalangium gracile]|uniref:hypothetical protein n=1 Tax=Hyalangium gracile TaxID=394092 RepID=UPI001CC9EBFE|nr:hypothetical protein [Hyalangium gracile]
MKTLRMKVLGSCLGLSLVACGGAETEPQPQEPASGEREVRQMVTCYAYLLDGPNFSGAQLAPFPVTASPPACVNLPSTSNNRTSSFRLANCPAIFYDGPNCTGASFGANTSGTMPVWFDNLATSVYFP